MRYYSSLIAALSAEPPVYEEGYYVSSIGSDLNNGTSPSSPWQTLDKVQVNLDGGVITAGTSVFLKRGDTFEGGLSIEKDIDIKPYDTGANPILTGLQEITGWTNEGGNIYSKVLAIDLPSFLEYDGSIAQTGAFPDYTYDTRFTAVNNTTREYTSPLLTGYDFTGASVAVRTSNWTSNQGIITDHVVDTITIPTLYGSYDPTVDSEYVIWNDPTLLTGNGNWCYRDGKLSVYSDVDITTVTVSVPIYDDSLVLNSTTPITISDIDIHGYNGYGIKLANSGNITLGNININSVGIGVKGTSTATTVSLDNVNITNCVDGVNIYGRPDSILIQNCDLFNMGVDPTFGKIEQTYRYSGIEVGAISSAIVEYCTIENALYNGMGIGTTAGTTYMRYNVIRHTNQMLIDGAAIYINNYNDESPTYVYNNIVEDGERGIYQDFGSSNCYISNNAVYDCAYSGYFTNDGKYSDVNGNIFYNCARNMKIVQWGDENTLGELTELNIFNNATYSPDGSYQKHMEYDLGNMVYASGEWADTSFGSLYENVAIANSDIDLAKTSGGIPAWIGNYTISEWKALGYDRFTQLVISASPDLLYNDTKNDLVIEFAGFSKTDAKGVMHYDSLTLAPFESTVIVSTQTANSFYISNTGNDLSSGTSPETAWATLDNLQVKLDDNTVLAEDAVFLNKGDSFSGALTLDRGITFDSYGTGDRPKIDGFNTITGWTDIGGNIYTKTIDATVEPYFMYFDGSPVGKGGLPNDRSYIFSSITNTSGDWTITTGVCEDLNGSDYTGGEISIRLNLWANGVYNILSHSGNTITFDASNTSYKPTLGTSYFWVQNHPSVFTNTGDWSIIGTTLSVYSTDAITNHEVKIPTIDNFITADFETTTLNFRNIDVTGISNTFMHLLTDIECLANIHVKNVDFEGLTNCFAYEPATVAWNGNVFTSQYVNMTNIFDRAYNMGGRINYSIIKHGDINNCGMLLGIGKTNIGGYNGLVYSTTSDYAIVQHLNITDCGYNGISGAGLIDSNISYNYIADTNQFLVDGGGIHIGTEATGICEIHHNILLRTERGIYQDHGGEGFDVHDNTVVDSSWGGYYTNDGKYSDIHDNTFFNCIRNMIFTQWDDEINLGELTDLNVYNNITFTGVGYGAHMGYALSNMDFPSSDYADAGFGLMYDNIAISAGDFSGICGINGGSPTNYDESLTFVQWQAKGYDVGSTFIECYNPELEYNNTMVPLVVDFTGETKTDVHGTDYVDQVTLQPFTSIVFIPEAVIDYPAILDDGNTLLKVDSEHLIYDEDGTTITAMVDRSGNGTNLGNTVESRLPTKTTGGVVFDGVDDCLRSASLPSLQQPTTVYFVAKQLSSNNFKAIYDGNTGFSMSLANSGSSGATQINAGTTLTNNTDDAGGLSLRIITAEFNGASSNIQINELAVVGGDAGTNNASGFTLGAKGDQSSAAHIEVFEVIIRDTIDSASDRQDIYDYLANKYLV